MALSSIAQSLIRDASRSWNAGSLQPALVTFSFATTSEGFQLGFQDDPNGATRAFTAQQQDSIRSAINAWGDVSGLTLLEVPDNTTNGVVDIRLRMADLYTWDAYRAFSPYSGGDISLNTRYYADDPMAPGGNGYSVLLLMTGYALGLRGVESSMSAETAMASISSRNPPVTGLRAADIEAIQYMYGTQQDQMAFHTRWSWDAPNQGIRHDGNESSQTITGTKGRDIILGYGGDDTIDGQAGNDLILAGAGTNTVRGGDGFDTLRVHLFRAETNLQTSVSNVWNNDTTYLTARGSLAGGNEVTNFQGIETIQFIDGRLVFDETDAAAQVTRLYQAALGRAPETAGREGWITALQAGAPLTTLAQGFLASGEFLARFGTPDDAGFVATAYRQALGREPDAAGAASWTTQLANGMSRAELLVGFSESNENRALTKPLLNNGIWDADDQMADIARLYQAVLGRAPDTAGLLFWDGQLDQGRGMADIANSFAVSTEFFNRFSNAADSTFVQLVYQNTLGRAPDAEGAVFWMNQLAHGMTRGELVAGFAESTEFLMKTEPFTANGIVFA